MGDAATLWHDGARRKYPMPTATRIVNPQYLVETEWLAAHLADRELRVFDCTTYLDPDPVKIFVARSGRPEWEQGHIPGAGHLDLQGELSDASSPFRFTMPSAEQFAAALSRHGVGEGTRVVLYSAGSVIWAARIWWMLRAFGFDNAAILNGGIDKWKAEGRPLSTETPRPAPARFVARPRPEMIATKSQVAAAIADPRVRIVNALTAKQHTGEGGVHYGRPGRIAGSVNVPAHRLVDGESKVFLPAGELAAMFAETGADRADKVITYCGGGIAASADAFVLALLGHDNVALYDGSLSEWVKDPAAPMETGPAGPR
jgi:thiosulfate/3-mercaptopyruvate sulfurtransferase